MLDVISNFTFQRANLTSGKANEITHPLSLKVKPYSLQFPILPLFSFDII